MKTDVIVVSSKGNQMEAALAQTEKAAAYRELSPKSALHLRLLAEEMMSMMRSIAGDVEGRFWIEAEGDEFQLHLQVTTDIDARKREQLISASSSGKNEATRGLMGKLRTFFEPTDDFPMFLDAPIIGGPEEMYSDLAWSMRAYQDLVQQYLDQKRQGAAEAWDELEKSVVSHVADDVKVSIRGREVEMVIFKKMA